MNSLHCSFDLLTLTRGLFCYHPYGNTIVITFCNIIVVVYVSNTQVILFIMCAVASELRTLAYVHYVPLWFGVMHRTGPTPCLTHRRYANHAIFMPLISNPGTGEQDYANTGNKY
jgi:hypothetical protein